MSSRSTQYSERSVADLLVEIKHELSEFVETRYNLFRNEARDTAARIKSAIPLALGAAVLLVTAYFLFTLAVVAVIAVAFWNNPYHWFFAFLIAAVVWAIGGAILAFLARNEFRERGFLPKTVEVLKRDKRWFENEVRGQHTL